MNDTLLYVLLVNLQKSQGRNLYSKEDVDRFTHKEDMVAAVNFRINHFSFEAYVVFSHYSTVYFRP